GAQAAAEQAGRRVAELEAQVAEQSAAGDRARAAAAEAAESEARLVADLERARERHAAIRAALERSEAARIDRQSERHATQLEQAQAEAELRAVEREIEHAASAERALETAHAERVAETARLEESIARLDAERAATAGEIEALNAERDEVVERLRGDEQALREDEERRGALESEVRALRRLHEATSEERHEAALARQDLEFRRGALREHVAETWGTELDEVLARHPATEEEEALGLDELEARLEEVRRKRANLGPVNMLAVEEFEKESERLEFLVTQRDDLVRARRQLEDAIRKINATARELFEETFAAVRDHFDDTFRTLFEGGHAEVRLEDPEDPLESPIEIVASPRGKRVQHISLLSGGERALTALALLFAIYQVKPSPFCVLDEVDAPLDDANVGRFIRMIRHFSERTQFVVVTHNKRTMEAADWLYGVTMEEPGVSTLVSVALDGGENGDGDGNGYGNGHAGDARPGNGHGSLEERTLEEVWAAAR
ncbi:MAG TPA: AAA family ATPase, partial [Gemmatimonadota bacterium]|nr:AAA family ATPase [Gemmatimonadota bacterium]